MKIESFKEERIGTGKGKAGCKVATIHVKISDVETRAAEMIATFLDSSWINKLDSVMAASLKARSEKTVMKLVHEICSKAQATNSVTTEFGEYMISDTAQCALERQSKHTKLPLAELLKERISGNAGFDFHTENQSVQCIFFGESKYSGVDTPYGKALDQIISFIESKKDLMDLSILKDFVNKKSLKNVLKNKKAYVAAFSLNTMDPTLIFKNAFKSKSFQKLLAYSELYLIGVEVCD